MFLAMTPFLYALEGEGEELYRRRIVWPDTEHVWRYAVEVDRLLDGDYQEHVRGFTRDTYFPVSLPAGEFRFRIIPHDILDRPATGTPWIHFVVLPDIRPIMDGASVEEIENEITVIGEQDNSVQLTEGSEQDNSEQLIEDRDRWPYFNTVGVSVGSALVIDPLVILTVHGTYAPMRNIFIELGCDIGFGSIYNDVDIYYSVYPFAHLGYFLPITNNVAAFAGAGAGFMFGSYGFSYGNYKKNVFGLNCTAGLNLLNFLNISYTLRTSFNAMNSKVAVGYVYRFR